MNKLDKVIIKALDIYKEDIDIPCKFNKDILTLVDELSILAKKLLKKKYQYITFFDKLSFNKSFGYKNKLEYIELGTSVYAKEGLSSIPVYGVIFKKDMFSDEYILTKYNIFNEIPNANITNADKSLYEFTSKIDIINDKLERILRDVLNKNKIYNKLITNHKLIQKYKNDITTELNKSLENGLFFKKTHKKIYEFYMNKPENYYFKYTSISYNKITVLLYSNENMLIGKFIYTYNNWKFEPDFKNGKYLKSKVSSMRYMRKTFLNHFINSINN